MENENQNFSSYVDLASATIGGKVLYANDEFFAKKENLLKPEKPIFIPDKYTPQGKWMDGWESRRKRQLPGNDWAVIKLGLPGIVRGVDIDTRFFTGNFPPQASIDGLFLDKNLKKEDFPKKPLAWFPLLDKVNLKGDSQNFFHVNSEKVCHYLRLSIFPDGGVARFRVYGEVKVDWKKVKKSEVVELSSMFKGGRALSCSDMHYSDRRNLLKPKRGVNMGDGWETKRRRGPGYDWAIIKLGKPGVISKFEVDTAHFKGNFPDSCSIQGLFSNSDDIDENDGDWQDLVPQTKLKANHQHFFSKEIAKHKKISHIKLNSFPDGGISRFRAFGKVAEGEG